MGTTSGGSISCFSFTTAPSPRSIAGFLRIGPAERARTASSRRAQRRHRASLCMACSEARGRPPRVAQSPERAPRPVAAPRTPSPRPEALQNCPRASPQFPLNDRIPSLCAAWLDAPSWRQSRRSGRREERQAHDATKGSRARRLPCSNWRQPKAQQHGPRVPATTRCGFRGY